MKRIRKVNRLKPPSQTRWLVSYADYMTLMFALFVVLYSSAIVKESSFDILTESIGKIFDAPNTNNTDFKGESILEYQSNQMDNFDGNSLLPEKGSELLPDNLIIEEPERTKIINPLDAMEDELKTALYQLTENGLAKLEQDDDWLTIELSSGLLFPSGSATFSPAALIIIKELSKIFNVVDNLIEIRG